MRLTNTEKDVLEAFWSLSKPLCVRDILLFNPKLNKNTVPVIIRQLKEKNFIEVDFIGKNEKALTQYYKVNVSKEDFVEQDLSKKNMKRLVANFIEGSENERELDELEALICAKRQQLKREE